MGLMLDDCRRYLESLGMGEELVRRGLESIADIRRFLPAEPDHVFVSECRDEEGERSFGSLWLLGASFMSEGFRFTTDSEFDLTRVDSGVTRIVVDREAFDFDSASDRSRLTVTVDLGSNGSQIVGTFNATGPNCLTLQRILESYLAPLLVAG